MEPSTIYDVSVLLIIASAVFRGYKKGIIHQIGSLIALAVGAMVSLRYAPSLATKLPGQDEVRSISAFVILMLATTLIIWSIVNIISGIINDLKLNSWNKQMGALVGMVMGIILAMILTFILLIVTKGNNVFIAESHFGPPLRKAVIGAVEFIPADSQFTFAKFIREKAVEIKQDGEENPALPPGTYTDPSNQSDSNPPVSTTYKSTTSNPLGIWGNPNPHNAGNTANSDGSDNSDNSGDSGSSQPPATYQAPQENHQTNPFQGLGF